MYDQKCNIAIQCLFTRGFFLGGGEGEGDGGWRVCALKTSVMERLSLGGT